jgi:hypothetical protein
MPPKKSKKKKPKKKRMVVEAPFAKFATGANRQIPGGIIGGGGGGAPSAPASFIQAGYASRAPPPATPIQTPDQFTLLRSLQSQAETIQSVVEEQKKVRKERSDKGMKRGASAMPTAPQKSMKEMASGEPLNKEFAEFSQQEDKDYAASVKKFMEMGEMGSNTDITGNIRMTKKGTPDKRFREIMQPPPGSPPVIQPELFAGGAPARQQGMMMGAPGRLRGSAPDGSTSLVGVEGIGEADVVVQPEGGLQDQ